MNRRTMLTAALLGTAAVNAQNTRQEVRVVETHPIGEHAMFTEAMPIGSMGTAMSFVAAGNMDGKVVKNAPYSADSQTESTRSLADGTRIVNKNTATMARDKDGRTRRENDLGHVGPFNNANIQLPKLVTIIDPVAKEILILNANDRTARKSKMGEPVVMRAEAKSATANVVSEERVHVMVRKSESGASAGGQDVVFNTAVPPPGAMATISGVAGVRTAFDSRNLKTESLGKQTMEGVLVEGTRTTHTIPAGEIGNDRPLVTVSERWYSPELQMVIFSKNTDPQVGETIYRVTNLKRTEPDAGLFKVPGDYKIQEAGHEPMFFRKMLKATPAEQI